jgi:hypothetical protein
MKHVTDEAEAAWEAYRGSLPGRRRTSILAHRIFLAGYEAAKRASEPNGHSTWTVNDDGSVSPPGRGSARIWAAPPADDERDVTWQWSVNPMSYRVKWGEEDRFLDAKAALLAALEGE